MDGWAITSRGHCVGARNPVVTIVELPLTVVIDMDEVNLSLQVEDEIELEIEVEP